MRSCCCPRQAKARRLAGALRMNWHPGCWDREGAVLPPAAEGVLARLVATTSWRVGPLSRWLGSGASPAAMTLPDELPPFPHSLGSRAGPV